MNKCDFNQLSMFGESDAAEPQKELIIVKKANRVLSKNQQTFNKFIRKIEKLQTELQDAEKMLEQKLTYYGNEIHPLEQELLSAHKKIAIQLYGFYKGNMPISKADRKILKEVIEHQLDCIISIDCDSLDEELKKIFKAIEGISYEKAQEEEMEMMKDEMAEMFEDLGFKMNIDDLHSNMTEAEMAKKIKELQESLYEQMKEKNNNHQNRKRKKTKKQAEQEVRKMQVEEARKKNITGIYRQLAKVLHPDLELDPAVKAEKEVLMKQLTEAYQNSDLHTLLRLELLWIQKEEGNPDQLTEEKLSIYNEVLKEQVQDLEDDITALAEHPRFSPLKKFSPLYVPLKKLNMEKVKAEISRLIADMQLSIEALNGKNALKEINQIVAAFRKAAENSYGFSSNFEDDFYK